MLVDFASMYQTKYGSVQFIIFIQWRKNVEVFKHLICDRQFSSSVSLLNLFPVKAI